MSCIHTGAQVVVNEYAERVTCDIHLVGGCLVLRISNDGIDMQATPGPGDYVVRIRDGNWFDRGNSRIAYSTLVAPLYGMAHVPSEHRERWPHLG